MFFDCCCFIEFRQRGTGRERETSISCLLYTPHLEIKPTTSVYGEGALINWGQRKGLDNAFVCLLGTCLTFSNASTVRARIACDMFTSAPWEPEFTDSGLTTYKNKFLTHNVHQPIQETIPLSIVTSPGSHLAISKTWRKSDHYL